MASRDLNDLHPELLPLAYKFLTRLKDNKLDIIVTCTWRSPTEQAELYAIGRTKPGKIVTNAKAGQSEHNYIINGKPAAKAFDIVPLVSGKCVWNADTDVWKKIGELWSLGIMAGDNYLDWYGKRGAQFPEVFHFCLKTKTR